MQTVNPQDVRDLNEAIVAIRHEAYNYRQNLSDIMRNICHEVLDAFPLMSERVEAAQKLRTAFSELIKASRSGPRTSIERGNATSILSDKVLLSAHLIQAVV